MSGTISMLPAFRPIGGGGTNPDNPKLDPLAGSPETSTAPFNFAPGTSNGLIDGPNPRTISNDVVGATGGSTNAETTDTKLSGWLYVFGQFVDHDLDREGVGSTDIGIPIPKGDPNFPDGTTIPLQRAITDPATGTVINNVTGVLDLSQLYGSDAATAASLRNADGTLQTSAGNAVPLKDGGFVSGDTRVGENPELVAITSMFLREHNYWVGVLQTQHPDWSGDQRYDMAKSITTAEYQNIIYSEYLPALVGKDAVGPFTGFDSTVSTQISQEFATSAFRVGHTQVSDNQAQIDNNGNEIASQSLAESFANTPEQTVAGHGISAVLRNLSSEFSQATDAYAIDGLRNLLVSNPDVMDLIAIDIQRERDLGISSLNQTRIALGLTPYASFADLTSDPAVQQNLQAAFGSIDQVDLFTGGIAENHAPDAAVGSTFQAIIAHQFSNLRTGDSFFWQNQAFDPATRKMISQTTLSDIIERDTRTPSMQRNAFITQERHASDVAASDPNAAQLVIGVNSDNATIAGGPADDTIVAGLGTNQSLTGGGGSNVFLYNGSEHTDTITDFNPTVDKIQFQSATNTGNAKVLSNVFQDAGANVTLSDFNGNAVVQFNGNNITLTGVTSGMLSPADFLFPPGSTIGLENQHVS